MTGPFIKLDQLLVNVLLSLVKCNGRQIHDKK